MSVQRQICICVLIRKRWEEKMEGYMRCAVPWGLPLHMLYWRYWRRKCRTKTKIYNLVCLEAFFPQWTGTANTCGDLQTYWSSFLVPEMFNSDRWGEDRETERQCMHMYVLYFFSVCLCNNEMIVPLCVPVCAPVMLQLLCLCVSLCVSVFPNLCLCLCVRVLLSLAEREHPSDRRAQPQRIKARTTTAPFCERCWVVERIFTEGWCVSCSIM